MICEKLISQLIFVNRIIFQENYEVMHKINRERNNKQKSEFTKKELNDDAAEPFGRDMYEDSYGIVLRPDWKIKTSQTKSYSYEGFLPNEDSNFNDGADLEKPNNKRIGSVNFKITQKEETCFHTVQNEIANIFDEDFDISKSIFPVCCKSEVKCKSKTTKCMSVLKTLPTFTVQPKKTTITFKQPTPPIPTCVHHSVSNAAVVNVVIHVKCDHPEAREHAQPSTLPLYPPLNCPVTKDNTKLDFNESKFNFSVNFIDSKTTEVTKYSILSSEESPNKKKPEENPCVKKYDNSKSNQSPDDKLFGEQDKEDFNSKDDCRNKLPQPQPLMPHDITIKITKPTHKPQTTPFPAFICQITPSFCKSNATKSSVLTRSVKPGFTLWKRIKVPHFWQSIPTTQNNGCLNETETKIGEPACTNEKTENQTTEELSSDTDSCLPDVTATEETSASVCEESGNPKTDFETTPESVTCEANLSNPEQTDLSTLTRDENNESGLTLVLFPMQCGLDSTVLQSIADCSQLLDQPTEPCNPDTVSLEINTETAKCLTERGEPSTEPYKLNPEREPSLMEADRQFTEYASPSAASDEKHIEPARTPKTSDELGTQPGRGSMQDFLQPKNKEETTVKVGDFDRATPDYGNAMTMADKQNVLKSSSSSKMASERFIDTNLLSFLKTDLPPHNHQDLLANGIVSSTIDQGLSLRRDDDSGTPIPAVNLDPHDKLNPTPFTDTLINSLLGQVSEEEYTSTISISKLIESEQSVNDFSTGASEAAAETLSLVKDKNHETSANNSESSSSTEILPDSGIGISDVSTNQTPIQTESAFLGSSLEEGLSTIAVESNKITEGDIGNIIELSNNSFIFYRNHKWFITNPNHVWHFDEGTVEIVNDTFTNMSIAHSTDNNEKNVDTIKNMFGQRGAYDESEEVPFEMFVQAVLLYSESEHEISTFEWSGIYFNLKEMIAMLRVMNVDSSTVKEWGSVNWINIYRLVKESPKTTSHDRNEYNITEFDGSIHSLVVFSNGTSIWKNTRLERSDILNIVQSVNSKTYFLQTTIYVPYQSNDSSLISFVKHVFQERINSNVKYSEYIWGNSKLNWDEIQALLVIINTMLTGVTDLEIFMRKHWDNLLVEFRSSKRQYYTDRTVYEISGDKEIKPMTIFTNGTTDFDGKRVTLDDISKNVRDFVVSEVATTDVQHMISLGGEKLQFYWNEKWYITDHNRTWRFENETSALMNESFFSLPEDLTISRESIQKLLAESSYNNNFEMPFELFAQSILTAAKYSESIHYQWSGYSFSYGDIFSMLRLSNFNDQVLDYKWGQTNWHAIYDKMKKSPKSTSPDLQAYEMLDYDGSTYPLIVFTNGTSIWKHSKLDLAESLRILRNLNSESYFPDVIIVSSYIANSDSSFLSFMSSAVKDRIHNKILHTFYIWKTYQFMWEDLLAIHRILLLHYESKLADEFRFSKIALPVLNSTKHVFPNRTEFLVNLGSENKLLIVYSNGNTEYENARSEFMDTVQKVEELKKSSNMVFKEDLDGGFTTLKEANTITAEPVGDSSSKSGVQGYDWKQLNNNPYFNVCYPINLGGGKVQFYMRNTWFITDGANIWPFEDPVTNLYINGMVTVMKQIFTDDPRLDKSTIQSLVDNKQTLKGLEELVMPYELIIQHYLFFMKHLDQQVAQNTSQDIVYQRAKLRIKSVQLIIALRLSAYDNFAGKEVELPWEKGKKLNWDWFFFMGKRVERMQIADEWTDALNTSYFEEFQNTPLLLVYSNFSSEWGSQRLDLDEALKKTQQDNERNDFLPVEVNGELTSTNESFEWLYKEALRKRFENQRTYLNYKWMEEDYVSWSDILILLRFPEVNPEAVHDNMFWKNSIKGITRAWKAKYSDKIDNEVSGIDPNKDITVTIYLNESTVFNGKKMDIEEYRVFL